MKGKGFFDEEFRLEKLSRLGDSLEKLNERIDWELFRPALDGVFPKKAAEKGGRPPFDYVLMLRTKSPINIDIAATKQYCG